MFPVAHDIMLDAMLADMEGEVRPADLEERLRAIGRRMASRYSIAPGSLRTRLEEITGILDNMGGVLEIEEANGELILCGYSCPLSSIPQVHPGVCKLMEEMLASMLSVPVREQCDRSEKLACQFVVPNA